MLEQDVLVMRKATDECCKLYVMDQSNARKSDACSIEFEPKQIVELSKEMLVIFGGKHMEEMVAVQVKRVGEQIELSLHQTQTAQLKGQLKQMMSGL